MNSPMNSPMNPGEAPFTALVLAAGMGKRMKSDLPKVLHPALGRPLIAHVLSRIAPLRPDRVVVVVGHREELVRAALEGSKISFATQEPQLGTGHATQVAWDAVAPGAPTVLVIAGDTPLVRTGTLRRLLQRHFTERNAVTVLSAELGDPTGYGRIIRTRKETFEKIVEEKDASTKERKVQEVNSGIYAFSKEALSKALGLLKPDNAQKEYYLTDTLALLRGLGMRIGIERADDSRECLGVNTPEQLQMVEETLRSWGEG